METPSLLESYLKQLGLPAVSQHYRRLAEEATRSQASYEQFLCAVVEQEIRKREQQRLQRLIRGARFPVVKELADFQFAAIPSLNQQQILDLAQSRYITAAESVVLIGNPGLGKPQPSHYLLRCERFLICLVAWSVVCSATSVLPHRTMCWQSSASARP